jgi:hemerythrin superfamily protein
MQGERTMAARQPDDAIALLKADHQQVQELFARYESAQDFPTRQQIADQVFTQLNIHAQLEETLFYPAFEDAADEEGKALVEEALQDHQLVKDLIVELQGLTVEEEFAVQFQALMDNVQQHVEEEETEMFPAAEHVLADDMQDLLVAMQAFKRQLMAS